MNRLTARLLAVAMVISTAGLSRAANSTAIDRAGQLSVNPAVLAAPTVLPQKVALNPAELASYQQKTKQSRALAETEAAGSDNTQMVTVIVVTVVIVGGIVALTALHDPGVGCRHF